MKGKVYIIEENEYTNSFCGSTNKQCKWFYRKKCCRLFGKLDLVKGKARRASKCITDTITEEITNDEEKVKEQEAREETY
jgi:hypothetical protein